MNKKAWTFPGASVLVAGLLLMPPAFGAGNRLAVSPDEFPANQETLGSEMGPMARGEAAYRARNYEVAMDQFGLVAATSEHPFAWLRIGNIWHRRGNVPLALDAYNRARDAAAPNGQQAALFNRALMNISLLTLEQARQAVAEIGSTAGGAGTARWLGEVRLRLTELSAAMPPVLPEAVAEQAARPQPVSLVQETIAGPGPAEARKDRNRADRAGRVMPR